MYKIWKNLPFIFLVVISLNSGAQTDLRSDSFDVLHYDIQLGIRNLQAKQIGGTTTITILAKKNNLNQVRFDLIGLQVLAVRQNTISSSFTHLQSNVSINLAQSLTTDDTAIIEISYVGQPITDSRWGGFFFSGNYAYNMGVGMGSNPPTFGRCWFPCVDNFTDRATYEFRITTDSGFTAACGGILQSQTNQGDSVIWHWKLHQTIPTYLASVAVGKYSFVKYTYQGSQSSYPVWLAAIPGDTARLKLSFEKLNTALQCFESKFGPYLFDRVGYAAVPFNAGAMEHAANIAYPIYAIDGSSANETLMAHELAHNWFGNLVTCSSAKDMWLNEGWASYCEALFLECAYGKDAYYQDIHSKNNLVNLNAPKNDGNWLPVSGVPLDKTYGTHVYQKGALVVHNLRQYMGDSSFFAACKSYLVKYQYSHANSDTLKNHFQQFTNRSLSDFFNFWVYEPGNVGAYVSLDSTYNNVGSTSHIFKIRENSRYKSGKHHSLPIVLELHTDDSIISYQADIANGEARIEYTFSSTDPGYLAYSANSSSGIVFGQNLEKILINSTGTKTLSSALLSLNVQNVNAPVTLFVEHYWTPPVQPFDLNSQGIRMSSERFWRIQGQVSDNIESWAFFNYNGSSSAFLDTDLLTSNTTEDSIVLLYRPFGGQWQIHTDHTFQPGPSKTDKTGRFWVNKLNAGEYTFGIRDASVVGLSEKQSLNKKIFEFKVYPNPSNGVFSIQSNTYLNNAQMVVYDMKGKEYCSMHINGREPVFTCKDLKKGTYVIRIMMNEYSATQKVIIE